MMAAIAGVDVQPLLQRLHDARRICPSAGATAFPDCPGVYGIFVSQSSVLPPPFGPELDRRGTDLIYLGKATGSIRQRLYEEELRHKRPATFFRSLGAVLGYLPPVASLRNKRNQRNYRFSAADTTAITDWIDHHLTVAWLEMAPEIIEQCEPALIVTARPILNLDHNPTPMSDLSHLRARCRAVACSVDKDCAPSLPEWLGNLNHYID